MQFSVAKTRVIQNLGRGTSFIQTDTDGSLTTVAVNSWFNERQRRLCNERNFWFMRTQARMYLTEVQHSCLYDYPIADTTITQLKYKSDLVMQIQENVEKVVANMESGESWITTSGGAADTTHYKEGNRGFGVTPAASATEYTTLAKIEDLELFSDGTVSTTADIIHCWVWVTNRNHIASFSIIFDCNSADYATDIYTYTVAKASIVDGWNEFNIAKSAFTRTGATASKDWGTIAGIKLTATAGATGAAVVTWDEITMVKASPKDTGLKIVKNISEIMAGQCYAHDDYGEPEAYTIEKNKFRLYPYPDSSYILFLNYYGYPTDLSSDTDTNDLLNDFPDVLIYGATADGFRYLQEHQDA